MGIIIAALLGIFLFFYVLPFVFKVALSLTMMTIAVIVIALAIIAVVALITPLLNNDREDDSP